MSASSVTKAKRGVVSLQGTRPLPLSVPTTSPPRPSKRPRVVNDDDVVRAPSPAARRPLILYEHTPKVIHARPDEFKALVQRLTGRQQPTGTMGGDQSHQEAVLLRPVPSPTAVPSLSSSIQQVLVQEQDPLVLTLGQQQVPLPPPFPLDDHHLTLPELPSPGGAGFLLSPESFLFSPATMQAIHELIS